MELPRKNPQDAPVHLAVDTGAEFGVAPLKWGIGEVISVDAVLRNIIGPQSQ